MLLNIFDSNLIMVHNFIARPYHISNVLIKEVIWIKCPLEEK